MPHDGDAAARPVEAGLRVLRRHRTTVFILLGFALFAIWALVTGSYLLSALSFAAVYAVFVSGLNLFMGYTGQATFGQNAFAAIGGYGSAILTTSYAWDPTLAMIVSAAASGLVALSIGYPTLRLKGHYLAMATLALGLITYELSVQLEGLTQGYSGISGIPPFGLGRFAAASDRAAFLLLAAFAVASCLLVLRLRYSRFGRAIKAIGGNEDAARALGIDAMRYKLAAFGVAAAIASVSGSLMAHMVGFISPEVFGLHMVILGFTMLYIGGIGTIVGPLIGALVVEMLPETFRRFADYQDLVYGVVLLLILIYAPKGLASFRAVALPRRARQPVAAKAAAGRSA